MDALAVSVGNVHLQAKPARAGSTSRALRAIEARPDVPLVIHGGSGVPPGSGRRLPRATTVCKFNVGTELRQAFGAALREAVSRHPDRFDRIAILSEVIAPMTAATVRILRELDVRP